MTPTQMCFPEITEACSRHAGESNNERAQGQRGRILQWLRAQGDDGATDEEIQIALNMPGNTERPRRSELEHRGLVYYGNQTRSTISGHRATVWFAVQPK